MKELDQLVKIIGTPKETAAALGVNIRSFWNYKAGRIPSPMRDLIRLKLKEVEHKSKKVSNE